MNLKIDGCDKATPNLKIKFDSFSISHFLFPLIASFSSNTLQVDQFGEKCATEFFGLQLILLYLLWNYKAHINVEICCSNLALTNLYKGPR